MVEVVKTAMGVYGEPTQTRIAARPARVAPPAAPAVVETPRAEPVARVELPAPRIAATTPRVIATVQTRAEAAQARIEQAPLAPVQARVVEPRIEPVRVAAPSAPVEAMPARVELVREEPPASTPRKKPSYRGSRLEMFALSAFRTAPVVMLGDSLTERAQWTEITGCGYVANRGIGGDDSAGVLRRLDAIIRMRPAAVFLNVGVNDLVSDVPTETILANVRETIERLTQGGAKVYLTLVLPVTHKFARRTGRMDELNEAYVKLAAQTGATVVDFRAAMQDRSGMLREEMSFDGIHLTPAGYRPWRDAVAPLVARYCGSRDELVAQAAPAAPIVAPVAAVTNVTTAVKRTTAPAALATAPQPAPQAAPQAVADLTASIPSRPATTRGGWIIQIGAFPEHEKAQERIREAQTMAKDLLANADPFTEKVTKGSLELYRARFAGFNQSSAEAACSYFKRNAVDCIFMKR
jgi:lysophospholipase L1-like esterase